MNPRLISFFPIAALALFVTPLAARADARPDFDNDAKPILRVQPHLIHDVESQYEVKDSGTAKYPGDDDHRAQPPYIFEARPRGSNGPFNLRLLIQPGPPGRILRVVDITKVHLEAPGTPSPSQPPAVADTPSTPTAPLAPVSQAPVPQHSAPSVPATTQPPSGPTSDTPSGPIMDSGSPSPAGPSLQPPPDPAPQSH